MPNLNFDDAVKSDVSPISGKVIPVRIDSYKEVSVNKKEKITAISSPRIPIARDSSINQIYPADIILGTN